MLEHAQFADGKATDILSLNSDFFEGEIREGRYRILNVEQSTFSGADNVFPATIVRLQGDDGVSVELIGSAAVTNHLSPGDWVVVREGHIERR